MTGPIQQAGAPEHRDRGSSSTRGGAPPDCPYCHGAGYYVGGDESHICWCVREAAQEREDAKERAIEYALEAFD